MELWVSRQARSRGPDGVISLGEVGYEVAAAIVSDDFLYVTGGKIGGFRDDPDAGFGSFGAGDDAADVVGRDLNRGALLGIEAGMAGDQECGDGNRQCTCHRVEFRFAHKNF